MLNFRYHALSIAAVFVALVLGLLLGVAIGDQGLVSSAEKDIRDSLKADVRKANERADKLKDDLDESDREASAIRPLLVGNQLSGLSIGLVFLGNGSQDVADDVRSALEDTGGSRANVAAVKEPLDLAALAEKAKGTRYEGLIGADGKPDLDLVFQFGRRIGAQYVLGGKLIESERDEVFNRLAGGLALLQGVVVVRNHPEGLDKDDEAILTQFENGFVKALRDTRLPVTGAERTETKPSQISWYEGHGLTSVDNIDRAIGRAALVFALGGASGTFGSKSTADSLLPDVPRTNPTTP